MKGYYALVIAQLKAHGWRFLSPGRGSHEKWSNGTRSVTVSRNCYSRITANEIMKQAGIDHRF